MQSLRRLVVIPLLLTALSAPSAWAAIVDPAATSVRPQPELDLAPEEVVSIVVRALANNDDPYPDAGIETTFKFASPQNRANTGPLERFRLMIKAFPYGDMVNHRHSDISEVVYAGDKAYLLVKLIAGWTRSRLRVSPESAERRSVPRHVDDRCGLAGQQALIRFDRRIHS